MFVESKSNVSNTAAIAQAGILIGKGKSMSCADGLVKITEKISPLNIDSFPQKGLVTF